MAKYFLEDEIYYKNQKQPLRKTIITKIIPEPNDRTAICYDKLGNEYQLNLSDIYDDNDNPIKDARSMLKMTQAEYAEFIGVPKRTLEDWESQKSNPKPYVLEMIMEKSFARFEIENEKRWK